MIKEDLENEIFSIDTVNAHIIIVVTSLLRTQRPESGADCNVRHIGLQWFKSPIQNCNKMKNHDNEQKEQLNVRTVFLFT